MKIVLLLCLVVAGCAAHSEPPQPHGRLIPVDPSVMDGYRGDVLYPGLIKATP